MSAKTIIIIIVDLLIGVILAKMIFKTFKNFLRSIYYFFLPNIISIVKKDFQNDFNYSYRLLFLLIILVVIVLMEVKFFN